MYCSYYFFKDEKTGPLKGHVICSRVELVKRWAILIQTPSSQLLRPGEKLGPISLSFLYHSLLPKSKNK